MLKYTEKLEQTHLNICQNALEYDRKNNGHIYTQRGRKKTLEIIRTKLPRLPFRFGRAAQVMVDGLTLALPDTYSLAHLATL